MNVRRRAFHKLRRVIFRNAIATPFARVKRSQWTACDEPRNNGDEKYRKSARQDSDEKLINIALRAMLAASAKILSFLEN